MKNLERNQSFDQCSWKLIDVVELYLKCVQLNETREVRGDAHQSIVPDLYACMFMYVHVVQLDETREIRGDAHQSVVPDLCACMFMYVYVVQLDETREVRGDAHQSIVPDLCMYVHVCACCSA